MNSPTTPPPGPADALDGADLFDVHATPCRYRGRCGGQCAQQAAGAEAPVVWALRPCVVKQRRRDALVGIALTLALALLCGWLSYRHTIDEQHLALRAAAERRLDRYADNLERQIEKFGLLPQTAALTPDIVAFFEGKPDQARVQQMSDYLKTLNDSVGANKTFLIDQGGRIIASSNMREADSYVGRDISYRPYFQQAGPGRIEGYYAVGTTANAPGYYLATAVMSHGRRVGVVGIKLGLEKFENIWINGEQPIVVTDQHRVVILASQPAWKYRVLGKLGAEEKRRLDDSQQYNQRELQALPMAELRRYADGVALLRLGAPGRTHDYLAVTRPLPQLSMQMTALSEPAGAGALALARALAVAAAIMLAAALMNGLNQRRINLRERLAARDALQQAYGRLEVLVERRSAELRAANTELQHEVAERIEDARRLENFQQELIRTENLAVIGQVSAGIAHEINQPLAALSTLAANAVRFLERSDLDTVRFNLERICQLAVRMGTLTSQLRSFARRSGDAAELLDIATCVDNSVALIGHRLPPGAGVIHLQTPAAPLLTRCSAIRLEQVLLNLISNAIDAAGAAPQVEVRWYRDGERAVVEVADNGPGLSEAVRARLFEPFFSTKTNSGLGLGLAISADIIHSYGGTLRGDNGPHGGAVFTVELPVAHPDEPHEREPHEREHNEREQDE